MARASARAIARFGTMVPVTAHEVPKLRFWVHQAAEYVLGLFLVSQAVHSASPVAMGVAGGVVVLLAGTSDGPLSGVKALSRPQHRVADVVVAVALLALATAARSWLDSVSVVSLIGVGLAVGMLAIRTDYQPKRRRSTGAVGSDTSERIGRSVGRSAASAVRASRRLMASRAAKK
jgi:hypothetical protein